MSQTRSSQASYTRFMVESAMMIAIATVLSMLKIIHMPYGGSVTLASMLPIIIVSYRYGLVKGLLAGVVFGTVQQLLGLNNLNYVSGWYSVIAVIVLDYLLAYAALGFGGLFRGKFGSQSAELVLGGLLSCILRFVCHFVSGFTVWAGWGVPSSGALIYSLSYNSTYMLPETLVLLLVAWYLGGVLDFTADQPVRVVKKATSNTAAIYTAAGMLVLVAGVIADIVIIFAKLQNSESGEWSMSGFSEVKWVNVIVVTAVCLVGGISLIVYSKLAAKKSAGDEIK